MNAEAIVETSEQPLEPATAAFLEHLAELLEYPRGDIGARRDLALRVGTRSVGELDLDADSRRDLVSACFKLARVFETTDRRECEERYTVLFDLTPTCTLDLGYHLFGENYARGELLAGLAGEIAAHGVDTKGELPDHLPALLRLLARQSDPDDRRLLGCLVILPAIRKIAEELASASDAWVDLILALPGVIERIVPIHEPTRGGNDRV